MLRDNLVGLIESMRISAGVDPLALSIQKQASDDRSSCLENPRPEGAESSLTENVTSPFQAEPAQDSVACDLMEPIRPQVDAFLLDWLRGSLLERRWFFEERDGNCRLTGEFAAQLSETSKIWRQSLGPLAEWISHTLWTSASQPTRAKTPATRLTQNRKREAKGIPTRTPIIPMVSREKTLLLPKQVLLNVHDPIAQARRADSQRRQAAALKAWNAKRKPKWPDEHLYREKIQPRVAGITIPVLMSALGISKPYATDIRAGRRPHPRHWQALAELIGFKEGQTLSRKS